MLSPTENRTYISELKTGTHKVLVADIINHLDGAIVQYRNESGLHEQYYSKKAKKYFYEAMESAKALNTEGVYKKADCRGRELYVHIREVHWVDNHKIVMEDGQPKIEYHVFQTSPIHEGVIPRVKGDPQFNNGIPMDNFVSYKNIAE